ncbi:MAG: pseudouridine synthase [Janthinobacterium lividum]
MPLIALNKPYGTICQFSPHETRPSLASHITLPGVYAAGRLDVDSEGLLLLTDDGVLQSRITEPRRKLVKRYWAQVDGMPSDAALARLAAGVDLGDFTTAPATVTRLDVPPGLWRRDPPIRYRAAIPAPWVEIAIHEGKNRQVRRMTAAIGHPTLRLVRVGIGALDLFALGLLPGESTELPAQAPWDGATGLPGLPDAPGMPARRRPGKG